MLWLAASGYWLIFSRLSGGYGSRRKSDVFKLNRTATPDIAALEIQTALALPSVASGLPKDPWLLLFEEAERVGANALTAVLPVSTGSLTRLQDTLLDILHAPSSLREVILATPQELARDVRQVLWELTSNLPGRNYPEVSLHVVKTSSNTVANIVESAVDASTDWLLLLDENELTGTDSLTRDMLLNPRALPLPHGPNGQLRGAPNVSCHSIPWLPQQATFLTPPMVIGSMVLSRGLGDFSVRTWEDLGNLVSHSHMDMVGGLLVGRGTSCSSQISPVPGLAASKQEQEQRLDLPAELGQVVDSGVSGRFAVILETADDLRLFSNVLCRLQADSRQVHILLFRESDGRDNHAAFACDLPYDILSWSSFDIFPRFAHWLGSSPTPDVVISSSDNATITTYMREIVENLGSDQPALIRLPRADLPYCDWLGALSLEEWKHWDVPRIDISVITNDRPASLTRLLISLQNARYFGDALDLRINMDSAAQDETRNIVAQYRWHHGSTFVHHRIIHGGLLSAVVESWYPLHNHTYGLLLEDDVELSPLFYAWAKMAILHYRYGKTEDSSRLFGISLYQQKTVELRPEGRRPFNARSLFAREGLPYPETPYLSQIPCSWGAVYFPEHWREFQDYLSVRLSELRLSIGDNVVPNLRSNKWTKSWKKYFIELTYLRGYVMLYPNFSNFTSLSTNHLEVGSHVRDTPKALYAQKKDLFCLPLLQLPDVDAYPAVTGLLELPGGVLPPWPALPVLDHLGSITSTDRMMKKGSSQRSQVFGCLVPVSVPYDVRDLTCSDNMTMVRV
ncbi:hypothetical protein GLOTRDRAFT_128380 [Gloeophyllum trabeum ATCC 11539]|uniref:Glycosyltransferase 2 n=1 Tax=Gloeophyllum trabeum (strain ATCC 11539 / FP-39264 / Madison 617) TaxID=670483 RepID=S7Q8X7_GLOTA|nr:uncharacterized protein GLOTRDRAFT_128380 [Gloeophyllum trabeum ATCC 11539]EPQ56436.1 hypothetical protein GLOTRDRAFT_128380 [Gloeophyllum trabeum ATCC 11539]